MDEKQALVPRLRFPEFREAGEWQERPLSNFVESLDAGVSVNSGDRPAAIDEKGILKTSAVTDGVFNPMGNKVVADSGEIQRLKEPVTKNTIIISRMNTPTLVGANAYIKEDCENLFLPDRLWAAKPKQNVSMRFIAYILGSGKGRAALSELATGTSGSMKNIAKANVLELPVVTPGSEEQQKIANCLSSLDALIAAQAEKLEALKTHKQGLMQQLFPREGETAPRLRFPEFRDAGEWVRRKLSKLLKKIADPVIVEDDQVYREVGIRSHGKGIFHKKPISGKEIGNKRVFWIEENTLIVNIVFAWELAVANTTEAEKGMIASHRFPMYRPMENKADVRYMKYFFLTHKGKELLWIASPGGAGRNKTLGQKDFESLEFLIPERLTEQQKIADCLSSVDELIPAQAGMLDALKTHKKGLMQQLFPMQKNSLIAQG